MLIDTSPTSNGAWFVARPFDSISGPLQRLGCSKGDEVPDPPGLFAIGGDAGVANLRSDRFLRSVDCHRQCQRAGLPSSGSQNELAGTRHRRFSKLSFQNFVCTLSSRALVTR